MRFPTFEQNYAGLSWGGGDYGLVTVIDNFYNFNNGNFLFDTVVVQRNDNSVLDQSTTTNEYFEVIYYFAKSIGIVRKEITETNEIWNLVEYNVIQ